MPILVQSMSHKLRLTAGPAPFALLLLKQCRSHKRSRLFVSLLLGLFCISMLCAPSQAEPLYVSFSLGGNATSAVNMRSRSNDRASICDEYINPRAISVIGCNTTTRGTGDGWSAPFNSGSGFSATAELGYHFSPRFRLALAYGYQTTDFHQTVSSTDATGADFDKISNELSVGQETLGNVTAQQLFAIAYRDWPNRSQWTPFAGVGVGLTQMRKDFSWVWARSIDPADILSGRDQPNAEEIVENLAGTVSTGRSTPQDTMTGLMLIGGVSRQLTERVALDLMARWQHFSDFESDAFGGGVLRSHPPNLRLDGSEPVSTWTRTEDTNRYSVMLSLRVAFP